MPHVINGCGAWYYGKKNVQTTNGTCRQCGRQSTLTSYETGLYFVVVFIPIIPLGRKHIVDQCSACRRHYAISQKEWDAANRRLEETVAAYQRSPGNKQLAEEALRACIGQHDAKALASIGPEMEKHFAADDKELCVIASAYLALNIPGNAERALRAAVAIKNDDDACQMLGTLLARMNRPAEAEPYLQHIVDKGIPDRVDAPYLLAQTYQTKGDHVKALEWFAHCEFVNPTVADDPTFKKLRALSEKNINTNVSIRPGAVIAKDKASRTRKRSFKTFAIVVIIAALAYTLISAIEGFARKIYLVNGLSRPYTARLNGKTFTLAPHSITPARIPEGDINVEVADSQLPPQLARIHTTFLARPFDGHTYVINPDMTAILLKTGVIYSAHTSLPGMGPTPTRTFYTGQVIHQFNDIDYAFEDPPHSVEVERDEQVVKNVLTLSGQSGEFSPVGMLAGIEDEVGKDTAARVAQRHVQLEPPALDYLNFLAASSSPQEVIDCLHPLLTRRPLEIEIHRAYQNSLNAAGQSDRARDEYAKMLAADPTNKNLMYLASRNLDDVTKSLELCQQAAQGDNPCPYAFYSLGSYYYEVAQFPEALTNLRRASALLPNHQDIQWYFKYSLIANGNYDEALQLSHQEDMTPLPNCLPAFFDEVNILALMNKRSDADDVSLRLKPHFKGFPEQTVTQQLARLASVTEYCFGDPYKSAKALQSANSEPSTRFELSLLQGDPDQAAKELESVPHTPNSVDASENSKAWLILYIAASVQNRPDVAETYMSKAIPGLEKGSFEDRAYAAALRSPQSTISPEILRYRQNPVDKRVLLTALGLRNPSIRAQSFALAQKLNIDRRFPHLLIQTALSSSPH